MTTNIALRGSAVCRTMSAGRQPSEDTAARYRRL